mgnify:CR=1 FL=1|jgi:dnd system-associated protein 4
MGDRRIRVPKNKEKIINILFKGESRTGVFITKAELITFAATLGYKYENRIPFDDSLDPIRQDVFERHGCDTVINLIAIADSKDPIILRSSDIDEDRRITIFEEYANGGLEILQEELRGKGNPLEHLLLMINKERCADDINEEEFGLDRFL